MRYRDVVIAGLGHEVPPAVLSSAAIEDRLAPLYARIGLVPGRLELMTGIRERRYWPEPVRPSEVAARAGERAIAASGVPREAIGCVIHASVCRDFLEPATAAVVHDRLGLPPEAQLFDLSNACLGVASAMLQVAGMIESGQIAAGLVVAGENGKPLVDSTIAALLADQALTRRTIKGAISSLTIGSGAAAVLLSRRALAREGHGLIGGVARVATAHHRLCQGGAGAHGDTGMGAGTSVTMATDAEALLDAGLALAAEAYPRFRAEIGWSREQAAAARVITHQVGRAHSRALHERLELPEAHAFHTYETLGNVGSVSLPITLALAAEAGFVRKGDEVALLGIGSGISSVMLGVEW